MHHGAAGRAADRPGLHLDPGQPAGPVPATKFSPLPNSLAGQFASGRSRPSRWTTARTVFDDTWKSFDWSRTVFPNAATYDEYLFGYEPVMVSPYIPADGVPELRRRTTCRREPAHRIVSPFAGLIRNYQRYVWLPGTVYGLILLRPGRLVVASPGAGRRRRAVRRVATLLPWASSLVLIVVPAATAEFDYRYVTTAVPFGCLALALAFGAGLRKNGEAASSDGTAEISAIDDSEIEADGVSGSTVSAGVLPQRRPRSETGSAPGLPGDVAGGRLRGSSANAGDDKRDLAPDAG